ncbi:MAG: hypothetical protein KJZ64_02725 [Sphingomonadaceae bacterium]|nr:hypothetical protein [Sphingomonadaceae bacterium]
MRERDLSHVTGGAVRTALDDLPLNFVDGWDYEILAAEIRTALSNTIPLKICDPERLSNTDIQNKLENLSKVAINLHNEISNLNYYVDQKLTETSFKLDGFVNFIGFIFSKDSRYYRFRKITSEIYFLADFLQTASASVEVQSHKWRDHERKRLRIWRAETLIPIFTDAFGEAATVNKASAIDQWRNPTRFMIFFQLMMGLAFGEKATPNLVEVLETARNNLKDDVVIPGIEPIE